MAAFYLDEDIPIAVAHFLTEAGHSVRTTVAEQRLGRWGADQLLYVAERGWILVTHNRRDYRALHEGWIVWSALWVQPQSHGGILTIDKGNRLTASDYAGAIATLMSDPAPTLANRTYEWFAHSGGQWVEWRA